VKKSALLGVFATGFAVAALIVGVGGARALVPGDTAEIVGTYTTSAVAFSSDPSYDPCAATPWPPETFWAAVNGNIAISYPVPGNCSYVSSQDPMQPTQTRYDLTYTYTADWGFGIPSDWPPGELTLTMMFHTTDNIVKTETYEVTLPPPSSGTTTDTTTTTAPDPTTTQVTTTQAQPPPIPPPIPAPTVTAPPTTASEPITTTPTTSPAPLRPPPKRYVITTPSVVTVSRGTRTATITISTNAGAPARLCYRAASGGKQTCKPGRGTWKIKLTLPHRGRITRVFLLEVNAHVVARKTISVRIR
jgi:hypothetical protein